MLFSSLTFLYYFLPLTAGLYFLAPGRMKNMVLLLASLLFYGWGEPRYVLLMGLLFPAMGLDCWWTDTGANGRGGYFVYFPLWSAFLFCCTLNMQIFFWKVYRL